MRLHARAPPVYPSLTVTIVPVDESETTKATPAYTTDSPKGTPACGNGVDSPETPVYDSPKVVATTHAYPEETPAVPIASPKEDTTISRDFRPDLGRCRVRRPSPPRSSPTPSPAPTRSPPRPSSSPPPRPPSSPESPRPTEVSPPSSETSPVVTCPYVAVETNAGVTVRKVYETVSSARSPAPTRSAPTPLS